MQKPEDIQKKYYSKTAALYDSMHVHQGDEHYGALRHISTFVMKLGISSILDVGCGTGRGIKYFLENHPEIIRVNGIESVTALIEQAVNKNGIPREIIICGKGENLPFESNSFDAVCSFGVLHHVKDPNFIVKEMIRVAKKAIFISDSNRFGQRNLPIRLIKFLLYKAHLWDFVNFIKTRGKGYIISEGDGLAYSYSVFDSYKILARRTNRILIIPTENKRRYVWLPPLLSSGHVLLCGIK